MQTCADNAESEMTKKTAAKRAWQELRKPQEELAALALGIFQGRIFTSDMVAESDANLLPMIFMPLSLFAAKDYNELLKHPPTLLYGDMEKTFSRSINGYPIFSSMGMIFAQDAEILRQKYRALKAAAEEVLKA